MKRRFLGICLAMCLVLSSVSFGETATYPDGIYRGFYHDGGIEQLAIQFEMQDGLFTSIVFRGVNYKDGNYLSEDASDAQKATLRQYQQLADYLLGKGVDAIEALYSPYNIVENVDAVTTATIQSSKLISALWDGLNRHPFKLVNTSKLPAAPEYADGVYRGSYMEGGTEEVALELTLKEGRFVSLRYLSLQYKGVDYLRHDAPQNVQQTALQFEQLLTYLVGKPVSGVNDLYEPELIATDAVSTATLRTPKVISAIWDAFNRHVYRLE